MQTHRQDRPRKRSSRSIAWWLAIFLVGLVSSGVGRGQAVTILDSFNGANGAIPTALILGNDGNFYGTTATGGITGGGCVYQVTPQGVVTILHKFGDGSVAHDGAMPTAGLIQASDGHFYGTTSKGGSAAKGTVFSITSQGVVTILHSFGDGSVANDGATPHSSLVQGADGSLYGTTSQGGSAGNGTVFSMTLLGSETVLHSFGDTTIASDGASPEVGLTPDGQGNFYGTTFAGGTGNSGTVFVMNAQKQVSILYSFTRPALVAFSSGTTSTMLGGPGGFSPNSRLTLGLDGNLYGTTAASGYGFGALYKITPQGQETVLHYFGDGTLPLDGRAFVPIVENVENVLTRDSSGNFYGTTAFGGAAGLGTLYEMTSAGQVSILHSFGANVSDGILPLSGVALNSDGTLFGTTGAGGAVGLNFGQTIQLGNVPGTLILNPAINYTGTIDLTAGTLQVLDSANPFLYGGNPGSISISSGTITISSSSNTTVPAHFGTIFTVAPNVPEITSGLRLFGAIGSPVTYQITATQSPTGYAATGLPTGLTLDSSTGLISGTPLSGGTSNVTLTVTNAAGSTSATLVITILSPPVITSVLSEFGTTGATFGYQIAATGSPSSYAATGLPAGLSIDPITGIIFGTPTAAGTFSVSLSATNGAGSDTETLTLVISSTAPTLSQEYVLIHSFDDGSVSGEGDFPGTLIPGPNSTFYGVTTQGGANGSGTLFNLSARGLGTVLSALGGTSGASPQGLVQGADGNYYGTTQYGGSASKGTIFMITPTGMVTVLHTFGDASVSNDGANPQAGLILGTDNNFYGTTQYGGSANLGTIFKITPAGAVTILHSFGDGSVANDGAQPVAALVQTRIDGFIYGTTLNGGSANDGAVFMLSPTGTVSILHSFGDGSVTNDGQLPHAALVVDPNTAGTFIGTTVDGGTLGRGTLFKITNSGVVTILHNFGDGTVPNDGTYPIAPVVVTGASAASEMIFGTTPTGGTAGDGTVFTMDSSNNLTIVHNFGDGTVTNDGQTPMSGLSLDAAGNLYGTTIGGGSGSGTMYAIIANLTPPTSVVPPGEWTCAGNLPPGLSFDPTTGAITGTPTSGDSAGRYTVSITSPDSVTTTQVIAVTQTFAQWATAKGNANLVVNATAGDGVANALKYLFDINPNAPMTATDHAAMPTAGFDTTSVPGTSYVTLTYRENAAMTGMNVTLESSDDMVNWTPVPSTRMLSRQVGTDSSTNDPIMESGVATDGSPVQFVRLQVMPQ